MKKPAVRVPRTASRLSCALGRHRMRYAGMLLGHRMGRCERCSVFRPLR